MKTETPTLTDAAQPVTPYRHPKTKQTVAFHEDGQAFSATGFHIGDAAAPPTAKKEKPTTKN